MSSTKGIFGYYDDGEAGLKPKHDLSQHEAWSETILPADAAMEAPETVGSRRPLVAFGVLIVLTVAVLAGRMFSLQIVGGSHNLALAEGNRIREHIARAPRGLIYDRHGVVLAQNQASYDVTVVPQQLPKDAKSRQELYAKVAELTTKPVAEIQAKVEAGCRLEEFKICLTSPLSKLVVSGLPREQALLFGQTGPSLQGFSLDINPIRRYDDGGLLAPILGYTGRVNAEDVKEDPRYAPTDLIGKLGLEQQYEEELRGINGGQQTEVDAAGRSIKLLNDRPAISGGNLVLAIDQSLQQVMAAAIAKQMGAAGALRASGVAIDPRSGEVLASVSLPGYDSNLFSKGISQKDYQNLLNNPGQPLFNKAESGAYPAGSVIKPFGAAAALQEGIVTPNTTINDTGKIVVPNKYDPSKPSTFYGWERENGLGPVNVITAIARSSDIYFYVVMGGFTDFLRYLGVDKLTAYYQKFGFGSKTGIDLPAESAGRVPTPAWKKKFSGEGWYTGDTYNISVGQGDILVSPLQMATALQVIANGGTLYKPHLVTKVVDANGKMLKEIKPQIVRQNFISQANLNIVRQGMFAAVNADYGTACCKIRADVPVQVAGKTGTAETVVHDLGDKGVNQSLPHAWFEAFAPYDNPRIAIVILVEHSGEGAQFAGPAVRETLQWYFTQGAGAKR
jgi:penicillin-binding protein 2